MNLNLWYISVVSYHTLTHSHTLSSCYLYISHVKPHVIVVFEFLGISSLECHNWSGKNYVCTLCKNIYIFFRCEQLSPDDNLPM